MAALQLIVARWRDLGALTIGLAGLTLAAARFYNCDPAVVGGTLTVAAVLAAAAWIRGARNGVSRLGIDGFVLSAMTGLVTAIDWAPAWISRADVLWPTIVGAGAFLSLVGGLSALERPGFRPQRPWVRRRVPIAS